jgi:hypothetical protein
VWAVLNVDLPILACVIDGAYCPRLNYLLEKVMRTLLLGLMLVLACYCAALPPAFADTPSIIITGNPPETPDYTYNEIMGCLSTKGAFKMPREAFKAANEDCAAKAHGLTREDFIALLDGCLVAMDVEQLRADCNSADTKLRPYFVVGGPPFSTLALTVNELITLQYGCSKLADARHKARCDTGLTKVKYLLQNPLPEPRPIEPPVTPQEYLDVVKANPYWINSPRGDSLWLMDPIGRLVRGKEGNPISVPIK